MKVMAHLVRPCVTFSVTVVRCCVTVEFVKLVSHIQAMQNIIPLFQLFGALCLFI